ncbi:hypothetical protein MesoLjLc_52550 [Mesorhizobium sp. L-8-10]|nr:hypothetical protein MesoLjLb_51010 [Mesorhizobium sp. L-8-3]BCH33325.1 hypothetical protein MesoLjLc_52550 [Mesorhizobium sp. L-8-10]
MRLCNDLIAGDSRCEVKSDDAAEPRRQSGHDHQPPEAFNSSSVQQDDGVNVSLVMRFSGV